MTKKSQGRIARDRAKAARLQVSGEPQPQVRVNQHRPANLGGFKPTENGGFKLSAAERILNECRQGNGFVPAKEVNTCWDDLTSVYRECARMLFQHTMVSQVLGDKSLLAYLDDHETFNLNVKQFAADLGQMNVELQRLFGLHSAKTGGSEDPNEVYHSIEIFEQYKLWMERHDAVVKPVVMQILEQTNAAELKRAAVMQAAEQTVAQEMLDAGVLDINQISDVQFKDVVETAQPIEVPGLNLQAAVEAGMDAAKPEVMDAFLDQQAAMARGEKTASYQVDEAAFFAPGEAPSQAHAHHGEHHKHQHHNA